MKKILYIILASFVLFGCTEKLNKFPLDKMSDGDFFASEAGLQAFSNSFYSMFPGDARDNVRDGMIAFDNCDNIYAKAQLKEVKGNRQVPNSGEGWSFTSLRTVNTMLDNLGQCSDPAVRTYYEAIGRFFRAYFYYNKIRVFGDVPFYDHQVGSGDADLYKPRDSREVVMVKIIEDLEFAIANLPAEHTVYTVNKWTAMALLSRATLFEGTFRKYHNYVAPDSVKNAHDATWYLTKCAEVSENFIDNSNYKIYSTGNPKEDYRMLFAADKFAGHAAANEVILAENYNITYGKSHNVNNILYATSMGCLGMSRKAVASYLMADGSRFTDKAGWETMQFYEETQGRDPRLAQSIVTPGFKRIGESVTQAPWFTSTISGYQLTKFQQAPGEAYIHDANGKSDNDLIIFRAGEVYLNFAEAKAELGTITQKDLDKSITPLRSRVGMPAMILANITEADPFLINKEWGGYQNCKNPVVLEIRRERLVELGQEGHRYNDLLRWKEGKILEAQMYGPYFPGPGVYDLDKDGSNDLYIYETGKLDESVKATYKQELGKDIILSEGTKGMVNFHKDSPGKWDEAKDYFYPVPSGEIQLNPNLVQNPGWTI